MKKSDFKKLAVVGMTGGMLLAGQAANAETANKQESTLAHSCGAHSCGGSRNPQAQPATNSCAAKAANKITADSDKTMSNMNTATTKKLVTENELLSQLNDEGKRIYQGLDAEGKATALRLASEQAPGQNKLDAVKAAQKQQEQRASK